MKKRLIITLISMFLSFELSYSQTVNVLDFGCNSEDATECIQRAFDAGAKKVIIPNWGKPYLVKPLFARSNQVIFLEQGAEIRAKRGEFKDVRDALISLVSVENVSIIGYGAKLCMWKEDYQNSSLYSPSEWRHALNIDVKNNITTKNITIKGLFIEKSGGDGILIGGESGYPNFMPYQCTDVLIQDVVCHDNHRQGISVTGADRVKIINTVLKDTKGTPPQAGIDFEPDWNRLNEVEMINCFIFNNRVSGIEFYGYRPAWKGPNDISLKFKYCYVDSEPNIQGLALNIRHNEDNEGAAGYLTFEHCDFKNNTIFNTAYITDFSSLKAKLNFNNCGFEQLNNNGKVIEMLTDKVALKDQITFGGINFKDCFINDRINRNALTFTDQSATGKGINNILGNIKINNPNGAKIDLGTVQNNVAISIEQNRNNFPNLNITKPSLLQRYRIGEAYSFAAATNDPSIGSANGHGIEQVRISIRTGDTLVEEIIDNQAPYLLEGNTSKWKEGIYMISFEALSSNGKAKKIKAIPIEVLNTSPVTGSAHNLSEESTTRITLYPNPAKEELILSGIEENSTYEITSLEGKFLQGGDLKEKSINIKHLKSGIYLLKIKTGDRLEQVIKWVKE